MVIVDGLLLLIVALAFLSKPFQLLIVEEKLSQGPGELSQQLRWKRFLIFPWHCDSIQRRE